MKRWLLAAALLAIPAAARGQTEPGNLEWGLFLGEEFLSNDARADDDAVVGLRVGWGLWKTLEVELVFDRVQTNAEPHASIEETVEALSGNLLWNFWTGSRELTGAYLAGGVGQIDVSVDVPPPNPTDPMFPLPTRGWAGNLPPGSHDDSDTLLAAAAGLRTLLGERTALRYELRWKRYEAFDISSGDLQFTFGFAVYHRRR
ncbi:MAG: outer membrane beta-barrel protein [Acidobacteria bacterium]|nr:outer membrane beta-barrel protein [Acidobacteriota bacterium]